MGNKMNKKIQIICWFILSFFMIIASSFIILAGRIAYGADAFILAVMGYLFVCGLRSMVDIFKIADKDTNGK